MWWGLLWVFVAGTITASFIFLIGRTMLRTRAEQLEVRLGDVLLLKRPLPSSLVRAGRFVRVLLAHGPSGLSVSLDGAWVLPHSEAPLSVHARETCP